MYNLVILGGGFCGSLIAKTFDRRKDIGTTLLDKKGYFEFTPSIHKVLFDKDYLQKITVPYSTFLKRTRVVTDNLLRVTPQLVETENEKIFFDYLVISTGIEYSISLENKKDVFAIKSGVEIVEMSTQVSDAERILIIGGGLVGTEMAGELVTKKPDKRVIVVHSRDRLLERNPIKASHYAQNFLRSHGARIIFEEKVVEHNDCTFTTDKGRIIEADVGIWCAGINYNPWFMKGFDTIIMDRNSLKVNKHLQLEGYPHIFVGGDINNVREEKTAHNAERHARLIAKNLDRSMMKRSLITYQTKKTLLVISLGDWRGIIVAPKLVITGLLPGILKRLIERWALRHFK